MTRYFLVSRGAFMVLKVLEGSCIWGSSWREERAAAYGIDPDELEEHYRKRTTLGVNIFPEGIAQAVLHFASPARSARAPATCSTWMVGCLRRTRGRSSERQRRGCV